jgi:hypothetical protein
LYPQRPNFSFSKSSYIRHRAPPGLDLVGKWRVRSGYDVSQALESEHAHSWRQWSKHKGRGANGVGIVISKRRDENSKGDRHGIAKARSKHQGENLGFVANSASATTPTEIKKASTDISRA